ncbi:hypothetical protein [Bacillus sp. EB600]|uniref:hypothetical protein n=1 Tax=Bacillus sp. EB600 TaxID=2806345 RepID=UPI00210A2452|nr:hypothetical protein [Bacillus sp. EB600]MCQ6280174.1 hypothetical protein [Bacillus sp. EB600]
MATFLLAISFLLNGISIYFIIILYTRQNRLLEVEKTQEQFKKGMEDEISAFLFEMKEENEEFIKRLQQVSKAKHPNANLTVDQLNGEQKPAAPPSSMAAKMDESVPKEWVETTGQAFKKEAVKVYQKTIANRNESMTAELQETVKQTENKNRPPEVENEEIYRDLFINQVKILQNQGLSTAEIAKKLNKGKTEIELLLKFG